MLFREKERSLLLPVGKNNNRRSQPTRVLLFHLELGPYLTQTPFIFSQLKQSLP